MREQRLQERRISRGRTQASWESAAVRSDLGPVTQRPSIYRFILDRLDEAGRLGDGQIGLPDDATAMTSELKWAPGALDGAFGHHLGAGGSGPVVDEAAQAFVA